MSRKLKDDAYKPKYGLKNFVSPDATYRDIRKNLKRWDVLIHEITCYLGGAISYIELSEQLHRLLSQCESPQVRYFDKHGAFRLLGWLIDSRLIERKKLDSHCNKLNNESKKHHYLLSTRSAPHNFNSDKRCHPSAQLEFNE